MAVRVGPPVKRRRFVATADALINRGSDYAEQGLCNLAHVCFARALRQNPKSAIAAYNLGVVNQDMGHLDDAIKFYERALQLDPSLREAHYNLATIYAHSDQARAIRHQHAYRSKS